MQQLSVIIEPNILILNVTPLYEATKMAIAFVAHHMCSHANLLKVQTLSGNYLSFIICSFF